MTILSFALVLGLCYIPRLVSLRAPVRWGNRDSFADQPDEPAAHGVAGEWRIVFARHLLTAQLVVDRLEATGVTEFECTALSPTAYVVLWRVPANGSSANLGLHLRRQERGS